MTAHSRYSTRNIEAEDAKSDFRSGSQALDQYFRYALKNDRNGVGRVFVLHRTDEDPDELPRVLGFYVLCMASADSAPVSLALEKKLPKYPMPVALIGRLAVDQRAQKRGFGALLLIDAIRRSIHLADDIGCTGIVVDAKDEESCSFYIKHSFVSLTDGDWPRRLFLPLSSARSLFEDD